jgi:tight adherence protein C
LGGITYLIFQRLLGLRTSQAGSSATGMYGSVLPSSIALPSNDWDRLDRDLKRAGHYRPNARREFMTMRYGLVLLTIIVTGMFAIVIGPEYQRVVIQCVAMGALVAMFCWAVPRILLSAKASRRVKRIRRALPDALDMLSMSLTGGLSLGETLRHVSRELDFAHRDLATELLIVEGQAEMTSYELAFRQFADRIDVDEIKALTALITQGQRLGTDVVSSIREFADSMRETRRQTADERSSKASVKLLFPLTLCLMPSVFIILWGPAALELLAFLTTLDGGIEVGP